MLEVDASCSLSRIWCGGGRVVVLVVLRRVGGRRLLRMRVICSVRSVGRCWDVGIVVVASDVLVMSDDGSSADEV